MIEKFYCQIDSKRLFKKVIVYLLSYLVCLFGLIQMATREIWIGYIIMLILLLIAFFALRFQFLIAFIPAISLDNKSFGFSGTFRSYMKMNLKGLFLSIFTLGIYSSWYAANYKRFIADHISFPEKILSFEGRGGKLFVYMLLGLFLPFLVLIAVLMPFYLSALNGNISLLNVAVVIYIVGIFLITSLLSVLQWKWMVDYSFGVESAKINVSIPRSMFFILGQLLLGTLTLGIYLFAAEVKIFAYFAEKIILKDVITGKIRNVHFTGKTREGFLLYLGQTLLSIITLGLYIPVAYAKVTNWLVSHLEMEEKLEL